MTKYLFKFIQDFRLKEYLLIFLVLLVAGLIAFWHSLQMSLFGDEWLILWHALAGIHTIGSPIPNASWNPYGFEMIVFYYLYQLVGDQGVYYYGFSLLTRILAAISLYWFLKQFKLSPVSAYIGSILFLVVPIGIETTDWVRNFDSYLAIPFFLILVYLITFFKNITYTLAIWLLFLLIVIINPIRSHGVLLTVTLFIFVKFLFEIFILKIDEKKNRFSYYVLTFFGIAVLYLFLIKMNWFGIHLSASPLDATLSYKQSSISLIVGISNSLIPNFRTDFNWQLITFSIVIGLFLVYLKQFFHDSKFSFWIFWSAGLFSVIICSYVGKHFSTPDTNFLITLAIYGIFIILIIHFLVNKLYLQSLLLIFLAIVGISFIFYPVLRQTSFHASFEHRYLIYSAIIIPCLSALLFDRFKKSLPSLLIGSTLILVLIGSYFYISDSYLKLHAFTHNTSYCDSLRKQIVQEARTINFKNERKFFLFQSISIEAPAVYDCLTFGFMFYMGIKKEIWLEDQLPVAVYETKSGIYSMLQDGKTTKKYVGYDKKISSKDLYLYQIQNGVLKRIELSEVE